MIGRSVFVLIALTGVVFLQTPMGTRPHAPAATVMTHSEKQAAPPTQRSPQRSPQSGPRPARAVSVLELIANPSRYDGMRVEVVGVLSLYAPDNGLYAFQEAFEYAHDRLRHDGACAGVVGPIQPLPWEVGPRRRHVSPLEVRPGRINRRRRVNRGCAQTRGALWPSDPMSRALGRMSSHRWGRATSSPAVTRPADGVGNRLDAIARPQAPLATAPALGCRAAPRRALGRVRGVPLGHARPLRAGTSQ